MKSRPDVWAVGLIMVDDLYVKGDPTTLGLLGGGGAYAGARAGLVTRAGTGTGRRSSSVPATAPWLLCT